MKILAAADIHGSQYRINIILKNIEKYSPDLAVICGDITQFGPGEVAINFLNQIPIETFAVSGNIDTEEVNKAINISNAKNLNMEYVEKDGIPFIGIGNIDTINEKFFYKKIENMIDETCVIITHEPPYGLQDKIFLGLHSGSKKIRKIIENYNPRLVLCGHIHEDPGITRLGKTIVVNCSLGKNGEGALININDRIEVDMIGY